MTDAVATQEAAPITALPPLTNDEASSSQSATLPAPTAERTEAGQWVKGVSGNPAGRPPSRRQSINDLQQKLEQAVRTRLRPERVEKIVEKLCDLAEQGNVKAAQTVLQYTITKPSVESEDSSKTPGGIVIRIENATFKAQQQQKQQQQSNIIEGEYSERELQQPV